MADKLSETAENASEIYLGRIGCLKLVREEPQFEGFADDMIKCLKDSPIIAEAPQLESTEIADVLHVDKAMAGSGVLDVSPATEAEPLVDREMGERLAERPVSGYSPVYQTPLLLKAHWPRKNQYVADWYKGEISEEFRISYDGSIFIACARFQKVPGSSYSWTFGRESMRILETVFSTCDGWKISATGPTPMYPAFYIVFRDEADLSPERTVTLTDEGDVCAVLRHSNQDENERVAISVMQACRGPVITHYQTVVMREQVVDALEDMGSSLTELGDAYKKMLSQPFWSLLALARRYKTLGAMRRWLGEAYDAYVRLTEARQLVSSLQKLSEALFSQTPLLRPISGYTSEQVEDVFEHDVSHILQALRFYEEETRSMGIQRATVEAAVAWAVIGGLVVWLLTEIFG